MKDEATLSTLEDIEAHMTMVECALEVLFAREMARLPEGISEQAKASFLEIMTRPYGALTGDMNEAQRMRAIAARSVELAERFVHKVSKREASLRRQ